MRGWPIRSGGAVRGSLSGSVVLACSGRVELGDLIVVVSGRMLVGGFAFLNLCICICYL